MDMPIEARRSESSLHQLAPYIGKLRPSRAHELISQYSRAGELVVDPFCGSGVIPLEAVLAGRRTVGSDINAYAHVLTSAKITAPGSYEEALTNFNEAWIQSADIQLTDEETPEWVQQFFHPQTLKEILALTHVLRQRQDYFLLACLLGILHHQRPGFLSYPASHLVPYLRDKNFPRHEFPELYEQRAIPPRMIDKLKRTYAKFQALPLASTATCFHSDARLLTFQEGSVDAVITSPPYMNALSYGRDNRLRLWFLGVADHRTVESPTRRRDFDTLMYDMLTRIRTWLRPGGRCVLVVGDLKGGRTPAINLGESLASLAIHSIGGFALEGLENDEIPDIRRSRKEGALTKQEWTVVLRRA